MLVKMLLPCPTLITPNPLSKLVLVTARRSAIWLSMAKKASARSANLTKYRALQVVSRQNSKKNVRNEDLPVATV